MGMIVIRLIAAHLTLVAYVVVAQPILKLLPLGDSITFGCGSDASPPDWYGASTQIVLVYYSFWG
jgi:hypothetical protein